MRGSTIAALDHSSQATKRIGTFQGSMDALPVEVIGIILSHVASARHVMMASATCRKWREAAKHHLHKLSFKAYGVPNELLGRPTSTDWEIRITETLMRTTCLHELVIRVEPGESYEFQAAPVIAWLLHTKKTLRSLTFSQPIRPHMNILEKLGGKESKLEKLWWGSGYITAIDPTIHRFESLVSLTLISMENFLAVSNLKAILSACPKLESLFLPFTHISGDDGMLPHPTLELKSSSLKTLFINQGFDSIHHFILHMNSLERLSLKEVKFQQVKLVQGDGQGSLRILSIDDSSIGQLDIGESASLLHELRLVGIKDFDAKWDKFYQLFARASNLRELHLSDCVPDGYKFNIGLEKIALSFPCLRVLALNYQHAHEAFECLEFPMFANITKVELCTPKFHKRFTRWIADFLAQCPSLEKLIISGAVASSKPERDGERMAEFTTRMIQIMRSYSHVDLEFFFLSNL